MVKLDILQYFKWKRLVFSSHNKSIAFLSASYAMPGIASNSFKPNANDGFNPYAAGG